MHNNHPGKRLGLWKIFNTLICLSLLWCTSGCNSININSTTQPSSTPYIPSVDALVTFRVSLSEPLQPGDSLYLVTLDEVTGLAINTKQHIMEAEDDLHYFVILPFVMGSTIQYRYHRQGSVFAQEHLPDGRPVRYRIYHVEGPGIIEDIVSRWTDTLFKSPAGELKGRVTDITTGNPIPSLMIAAGGNQVYTQADGSFAIWQMAPGTHNLVALSLDGSYQIFQQGAIIRANSSTFAAITLQPSTFVNVNFRVSIPGDTPSNVPIRLAGNIYQLGNTFADLSGGVSTLASHMPTLSKDKDGLFSISLQLPSGIDLRYKYTLGDGLWNAERTHTGEFALRQIIIPDHDVQIQDVIESWSYGEQGKIIIDAHVPVSTNSSNAVYIQFDPGFGWTEPIPMWGRTSSNEKVVWNYILSSPLDMLTTLKYRFCLEGLCNDTFALDKSDSSSQVYTLKVTVNTQNITNQVTAWANIQTDYLPAIVPNVSVNPRDDDFIAGISFQNKYHPIWSTRIPLAISDIKNLNANWLFVQSTWSYTNDSPPTLELLPSQNPTLNDLGNWINHAHHLSLKVALIPTPEFTLISRDKQDINHLDMKEWNTWFENYSRMVTNYAQFANITGAEALVISDKWVTPPIFSNDSVPASIETNAAWITLIEFLRSIYSGKIIWALYYPDEIASPPSFLETVDAVYVLWSAPLATQTNADNRQMRDEALKLIDRDLYPFWQKIEKPIILALAYPSSSLTEQMNEYNAMMMALNECSWLAGIVSTGYYPPLAIQDSSTSVNGKPASGVLWYWFPRLLGQ